MERVPAPAALSAAPVVSPFESESAKRDRLTATRSRQWAHLAAYIGKLYLRILRQLLGGARQYNVTGIKQEAPGGQLERNLNVLFDKKDRDPQVSDSLQSLCESV